LTGNYNLEVSWLDKKSKIIHQEIYPLGWGLYPTKEWVPGQIVKTNFWLSDLDNLDHWNFELLADEQISLSINKWIGGSWLPLKNDDRISDVVIIRTRTNQ
jgi:hypothetical protein